MKDTGKRLRDKFLKAGIGAFHDYEIVELLLTLGTPRKDCKKQAKTAIKKFKGLRGVLEASLQELQGGAPTQRGFPSSPGFPKLS